MLRTSHIGRASPPFFLPGRGALTGIAAIILSLYTAVAIASVCIHADHESNEDRRHPSMVGDTSSHDTEEICQSVHEHVLAALAVSGKLSTILPLYPRDIALVDSAVNVTRRPVDECRPPGLGFFPAHTNFQPRSILRI